MFPRLSLLLLLTLPAVLACRESPSAKDNASSPCRNGTLEAAPGPVHLSAGECLFLFADPEGRLDFETIRESATFTPTTDPNPNFGYSTAVHWARITVHNAGEARDLLLEFGYPVVDHIDLFVEEDPGNYELRRAGDALPFDAREIAHRHVVFRIPFDAAENKTLYLRVQSSTSVQIPLDLRDRETFAAQDHNEQALLGMYYGMLLIMCLYNFWLYFGLRDVSYLYYLGHVLGVCWLMLMQHGLAYEYLWPESVWWNNRAHAYSAYGAGIFALLFCRSFLNLRQVAPVLDRIVLGCALLCAFTAILGTWLPMHLHALGTAPVGLVGITVALIAGGTALSRGYRPARFYLLAWAMLMVGMLMLLLRNVGGLPRTPLTNSGLMLGSILDVALLSLALADRLQHMKAETDRLNAGLGKLVDERTRELRTAYGELQAQDEARTTFFTNISHEIRTPLTLLLSPIETMSSEHIDAAERGRLLAIMRKNGRNLLKLVNDLLDVSRLDAGRSSFEPRELNLTALSREVVSNFEEAAQRAGLQLEFQNTAGGDVIAKLDAEKIEKVLFNLIGNALKFTHHGSVLVSVASNDEGVALSVADTGIGIPRDQHASIFERFRQVDGSDTRKFEGTGIGLYIVRRFTELHGGSVRLVSEPGTGSTFTIVLPQQPNTAAGAAKPVERERSTVADLRMDDGVFEDHAERSADAATHVGDETVLIVEDNADLLSYLSSMFRSQYRILTARDGNEGLQLARTHRPDLIVSDIKMPNSDGLELLTQIRADANLAETPLILLSAKAAVEDRLRGLSRTADDYVSKPFHVRELLLRVRNLLYRKRLRELAVARENERIYTDFHDYLGARLTDISLLAARLEKREESLPETCARLREELAGLIHSFRDCLSARDDLDLLSESFADGLHIILLRRYVNANRQLQFSADAAAREFLDELTDERTRSTLHAACTELATNDLRYGRGLSVWQAQMQSGELVLTMRAESEYDSARDPGHGVANLRSRLEGVDGAFEDALEEGKYVATLRLGIRAAVE